MASIPASAIVNINPQVLSAGGLQLDLNSVFLTDSTRVPIGSLLPFSSQQNVADFFGPTSTEATLATNYFLGYSISSAKPGLLYFFQYNAAAVSAYIRGSSLAAITLTTLKTYSGTLTFTIDGTSFTTASIALTAATSFSDAAAIIQAALVLAGFTGVTCTYDSISSAFVVTSSTTGVTSTITQGTGTLAADVGLSAGTLSQGAAATDPTTAMTGITAISQNWATFMTTFEPVLADKILFATWSNGKNNRYLYVVWDTDVNAIVANDTTSFGPLMEAANFSGYAAVYSSSAHAAFVSGIAASIDFNQLNARPTFAFKEQSGLIPSVTNETIGDILIANGYNFYGSYATANQGFNFLYPGQCGGDFRWIDSFVNQIYMNAKMQSTLMTLLTSVPSIPYNDFGYHGMIELSLRDDIDSFINYGAIRVGVRPSSTQEVAVTNLSGVVGVAETLYAQGYYLQVKDPGATARGNRQSPVINFWYMDGQAVQVINMNSINVQ